MSLDRTLPMRRLVLLGASNLSRGLPTLLATVRRTWNEPLDVVAAAGRGRSYGKPSRLLGRELSGITSARLWEQLEREPRLPTWALVTDVGNDIMYGATADQILAWVKVVLQRLRAAGAATVVTGLPVERLHRLGSFGYKVLRAILFPQNKTSLHDALRTMDEVDAGLRRLAASYGARFVAPPLAWYGVDPIHIRRAEWRSAWSSLVAEWNPPTTPPQVGVAPWTWLVMQGRRPDERRIFGVLQRRAQPCATFADGTRLSLY